MKATIQLLLNLVFLIILVINYSMGNGYSSNHILVIVIVFLVISLLVNKYKKKKFEKIDDKLLYISIMGITYIIILYAFGFISEFNMNYATIYGGYMKFSIWIKRFIIIFLCELVRYIIINSSYQFKKKKKIFRHLNNFILNSCFLLIELSLLEHSYSFSGFSDIYEFLSLVVIQCYARDYFLNYFTKEAGLLGTILYRIFVNMYIYFIPIVPDLNVFINAVISLGLPFISYIVIKNKFDYDEYFVPPKKKKNKLLTYIENITFVCIFSIMVALVSREFTYCAMAIGSESMTGTINKGDAVVYKKYNSKNDKLKKGDIIIFHKNNVSIIHRIIKVYTIKGKTVYQTKGDFNDSADNWIVSQKDIEGIYKARVILIGWPSVLLSEMFYK